MTTEINDSSTDQGEPIRLRERTPEERETEREEITVSYTVKDKIWKPRILPEFDDDEKVTEYANEVMSESDLRTMLDTDEIYRYDNGKYVDGGKQFIET